MYIYIPTRLRERQVAIYRGFNFRARRKRGKLRCAGPMRLPSGPRRKDLPYGVRSCRRLLYSLSCSGPYFSNEPRVALRFRLIRGCAHKLREFGIGYIYIYLYLRWHARAPSRFWIRVIDPDVVSLCRGIILYVLKLLFFFFFSE